MPSAPSTTKVYSSSTSTLASNFPDPSKKSSSPLQHEPNSAKPGRPRWLLHIQAAIWRFLMQIGMTLHKNASPRPPSPSFTRVIPTAVSEHAGKVSIAFYVPAEYQKEQREKQSLKDRKRWPVLVNFHGGGFTLGAATDDARWAAAVVHHANVIVASVDYRRAPEFPFPTAVEDGVDAVLYLARNAEELCIDENKIALSGFSSGGNMAFTVPLRLQEELNPALKGAFTGSVGEGRGDLFAEIMRKDKGRGAPKRQSIELETEERHRRIRQSFTLPQPQSPIDHTFSSPSAVSSTVIQDSTSPTSIPSLKIAAIIAWYPSIDYTRSRAARRATCPRPDQDLPALFTSLFDESYLQPPTLMLNNPYLSPGLADPALLAALPDNIALYTCEWDMLMREGEEFRERLQGLGKKVAGKVIEHARHGYDRSPFVGGKAGMKVRGIYAEAGSWLRGVLGEEEEVLRGVSE